VIAGFQYGLIDILSSSLMISTVKQKARQCIELSSYSACDLKADVVVLCYNSVLVCFLVDLSNCFLKLHFISIFVTRFKK